MSKIEVATRKDIFQIVALNKKNLQKIVSWTHSKNLIKSYVEKEAYYIIRNKYDKIIAGMGLSSNKNESCIEVLAVEKKHRKVGHGSNLVQYAKTIAFDKGHKTICVGSYNCFQNVGFYLKNGFKIIEERTDDNNRKWRTLEAETRS